MYQPDPVVHKKGNDTQMTGHTPQRKAMLGILEGAACLGGRASPHQQFPGAKGYLQVPVCSKNGAAPQAATIWEPGVAARQAGTVS